MQPIGFLLIPAGPPAGPPVGSYPPRWVGSRPRPEWGTCRVCHGRQGNKCPNFAGTHQGHDHRNDNPMACGQGCPCCRHAIGQNVCGDCSPHYMGPHSAFKCNQGLFGGPCEACLSRGSKGRHRCRRCGAPNAHRTAECRVPGCNLGPSGRPCSPCAKKLGTWPHRCNTCGALNKHRTADCPRR